MRKNVNGISVEMTEEEIAAMQAEAKRFELMEKSRPFTAEEATAMLIRQQINSLTVDDNTALRMLEFFPGWAAGVAYTTGYKVQHGGKLWRCIQAHTSQAGWAPGETGTESLWTEICEAHDGTKYDPVPYSGNMVLENGKYYTQDGVLYLCNRDTGNPVYHPLSALVGLYVTVVEVN